MKQVARIVRPLRQPEYTGENRCLPCTAVNIVIASILGVLFGIASTFIAGSIVFGVCLVLIGLRGYLIPGTPRLTRKYAPESVLKLFEKQEPDVNSAISDPTASDDTASQSSDRSLEAVLFEANVIEECPHIDDVCLTDEFQNAWYSRMEEINAEGDEKELLNDVLGIDTNRLLVEDYGVAFEAITMDDKDQIGQWESYPAFVADMAAIQLLRSWYTEWNEIPPARQSEIAYGLRAFLESCPVCGGGVSAGQETVASCCRSKEIVAISCDQCDARLFETEMAS